VNFSPKRLKTLLRRFRARPEGAEGVRKLGHREYVGGLWEEVGRLQFDFLVGQGLQPSDILLDIGCGALRGGVHFIHYLDPGHYLGIEKEEELIRRGIEIELGIELYRERMPELVASGNFEFDRFSKVPTFALAQSIFTHLSEADIDTCMKRLRNFVRPGCRFFTTFFETDDPAANPRKSHAHMQFGYTRDRMRSLGERWDWVPNYIGSWGHPRGQVMMEYVAA
jgi:hypothetical protein